jgi:hypothetical protein
MNTLNFGGFENGNSDFIVFDEEGGVVLTGHKEECELETINSGDFYCWADKQSRKTVRNNFN